MSFSNLIFYDTETTGIQKDFSQILQCGSVLTDRNLRTIDEQNIGCAPLPWVIPQPMAMLTNKKVDLFNSNISHYQMMKDIQSQWKQWSAQSPSVFITYNGHAFDEELIRRQFFWNLLEPYTTNTNGNGRLDLMLMMHNIAALGCAPLPWVIPQPMAMLTNKKVDLFNSNISHYQMMKDIQSQWKQWSAQSPSVFITYNGHAFDEELIRRQFFWNLLEPYTTNTNGNGRLDLMLMMHNIAAFFSEEIAIPLFEGGPGISYKLEHLAQEHGIDAGDAHDAIADCNLMIELCTIIQEKLPELFQSFIDTATKPGIKDLLYADEFLALGEIHRRHTFKYPVVLCGNDASRPNEIVFFDLSYDPDDILDLDYAEINKLVQSKGRDGPLKKYKINKTIPVCSHKLLKNSDVFDIEFSELQRRADIIKADKDFQQKVSQSMEDRLMDFPESEYIEGTIYSGGFPSYKDKDLMQEFHLSSDPTHLIKISRNFEDERLRLFAERIICNQFSANIPNDIQKRYQDLITQRNSDEGPWGSLEKTLIQIHKLLDERTEQEDQQILLATKEKIESMKIS